MKRIAVFTLALCLTALLFAGPEYPNMGPDIYDTRVLATEQIAAAVGQAAARKKHVLLVLGANWCIWCRRLHATFESDPKVAQSIRDRFEVVLVDANKRNGVQRNADVNERYGNPVGHDLPVIVVLDGTGKQLTTQDTGELEEGAAHSPAKILAFLAQWEPKAAR